MRRHLLGILSLVLLAGAVYGLLRYGTAESQASMLSSMCLRIGLVLGAIWLAFPQVRQLSGTMSPWMVAPFALLGIIVLARPRTAVVMVPIALALGVLAFVGWLLKPPTRR